MKLFTSVLMLAMLAKSKMASVPLGEPLEPVELNLEEERVLLELPSDIIKIGRGEEGFYTLPSQYPLMYNVVDTFREIMSDASWYSAYLRSLSEEEWVMIINAENPLERFQNEVRKKELKFSILKHKF